MIEERVTPGISSPIVLQEHLDRYKFALDFVKGKKVLDCACGTGYGSFLLSQEAIDYAQTHYKAFNLEFIKADACKLPFEDATFDVVTSFETFEHIENYELFLKECRRVLKPHGILIISTPNKVVSKLLKNDNPYHVFEMDAKEFSEILLKEFSLVDLMGQCDVNTSKQYFKRVVYILKEKLGIKRSLSPKKKFEFPVTSFKDGIVKSTYIVAVCYP